jgi:branched-chain amino acid transport system ATP-binding protein
MALLETDAIHAGYGSKQVLHGVSIAVQRQEVVAFVGHNGAGKSTLLKAIFGTVTVSSGRIWLDGADITNAPPRRTIQNGLGYCLQGGQVFADMTIEDNLRLAQDALGARALAWDDASLVQLFPVLYERRHALAGVLSGGERQMLSLAMTLLSRPRVCLLDEPSAGLAPLMVERIGEVIAAINRELGASVLLVEQNVNLAARVAQRVYVQANGRIAFEGSPGELASPEAVRALRGF